jgi:hypothetical protein
MSWSLPAVVIEIRAPVASNDTRTVSLRRASPVGNAGPRSGVTGRQRAPAVFVAEVGVEPDPPVRVRFSNWNARSADTLAKSTPFAAMVPAMNRLS